MTWGDFKKYLEEKGVTDDREISYIDVTFPEIGDIIVILHEEPKEFSVYS